MTERRTTPRRRSYLGARIAFNAQWSSMDCVVRDYTERGARLAFPSAVLPLPDVFELTIPTKGIETSVRVVWRREGAMGVAFPERQESRSVVSLDLARRLRACERERDALRSQVAALTSWQ